jgi:tetratricopeptide (TPR) repeat protein
MADINENKNAGGIVRAFPVLVLVAVAVGFFVWYDQVIAWPWWAKVTPPALTLLAFLKWYGDFRNNARLFICDVAGLFGVRDSLPMCREADQSPDEKDSLALLEFLKAQKGELNPDQLDLLRRLETHFVEEAFDVLTKAAGLKDDPVETRANADTRVTLRETVEEGNPEERRALAMIAEGDLTSGLQLLSDLATASSHETTAQWRRIGRLAYAADTARALAAYEKVVALDRSDPWDAIYLGRLYKRAGKLDHAHRTFENALAPLTGGDHRDREVLLNEIGDVLVAQGDLAGALENYRAAMDIAERLADDDPGNAGWQADLAASHGKLGQLLKETGKPDQALEMLEKARAIIAPLAEGSEMALWKDYLAIFDREIAALRD